MSAEKLGFALVLLLLILLNAFRFAEVYAVRPQKLNFLH